MEELRVDMNEYTPEAIEKNNREKQLLFKFNHTMPCTPEYDEVMKEVFGDRIGEGSYVAAPIYGAAIDKIVIGRNCYVNNNFLAMARGGVTLEDDVMVAANVQILTNNHDPYKREILTCNPVLIKQGAWIGAGASIMPGITIGKYAIVGAASVVTHDVPDYGVAVGNPARVVKTLDPDKFE